MSDVVMVEAIVLMMVLINDDDDDDDDDVHSEVGDGNDENDNED